MQQKKKIRMTALGKPNPSALLQMLTTFLEVAVQHILFVRKVLFGV